jgi:hypothetical protein
VRRLSLSQLVSIFVGEEKQEARVSEEQGMTLTPEQRLEVEYVIGQITSDASLDAVRSLLTAYDAAEQQLAEARVELAEKAAIIAALGHEKDELRARANAAQAREAEARHRAQRIVLDAELKARAEQAESALATLRAQHRAAVDRERRYLAAIKEYEEADINYGLAEARLKDVNDRADRLYRQWEEAPTDELQQRRRENLDDCLKQADVTAQARRRQQAARAELRNALNDAALNPDTPDLNTPASPDTAPVGEAWRPIERVVSDEQWSTIRDALHHLDLDARRTEAFDALIESHDWLCGFAAELVRNGRARKVLVKVVVDVRWYYPDDAEPSRDVASVRQGQAVGRG